MKDCVLHPTHGDVQLYENYSLSLSGRTAVRPTDVLHRRGPDFLVYSYHTLALLASYVCLMDIICLLY